MIVPTIGRPASLARLLRSLAAQTHPVDEVIVADGSSDEGVADVLADPAWASAGLMVLRLPVSPPHAVKQRQAAIDLSTGTILLMLDDDVELSTNCVKSMYDILCKGPNIVAVIGVDRRQNGDGSTRLIRIVLKLFYGMSNNNWQGKLIGPLMKFNYWPIPKAPVIVEWFCAGIGMLRRSTYLECGGYSSFYLDRATINEDTDLAIKLRSMGDIVLCPEAVFDHFHDPSGRLSIFSAAKDDAYNRIMIMRSTLRQTRLSALSSMTILVTLEILMSLSSIRRGPRSIKRQVTRVVGLLSGSMRGLCVQLKERSLDTRP